MIDVPSQWERHGRPDRAQLLHDLASLTLSLARTQLREVGACLEREGLDPFGMVFVLGHAGLVAARLRLPVGPDRVTVVTMPSGEAARIARACGQPALANAIEDALLLSAWPSGALRVVVLLPGGALCLAAPWREEEVARG